MANEKRLIDANALKWKIGQVRLYVASLRCGKTIISKLLESYRNAVFEEIENAPTVDAVEVVHGRWVLVEYQSSPFGVDQEYQCSICGTPTDDENYRTRYCPNCGAKMDGDGNDI